ncbi:hypothetical protein [Xylophilus sp. GOD-11R]|uniref:hypothetical protein n=1 Tax=Xylophilus sp. GOD-11R TaxID=3089814 RepID=UPI00298CAA26|nr:hypothetical protein [Xylophilus sp. GOD-11R]WPB58622.1 hypothetical protein R9X41_08300 [Xylophilus sp. GOD-11R]
MTTDLKTIADRMLARCVEEGDCLIWPGATNPKGLPVAWAGRATASGRRIIWEAVTGKELQLADCILMTCECVRCLNFAHMCKADRSAVIKLATKSGTHRSPARGQKLREAYKTRTGYDGEAVAALVRSSTLTGVEIERQHGIRQSVVSRIRRGVAWPEKTNPFAGLAR